MSIETYLAVGGAVITVITSVVLLRTRLDAMDKFESEARKRFLQMSKMEGRLSDLEGKFDLHANKK